MHVPCIRLAHAHGGSPLPPPQSYNTWFQPSTAGGKLNASSLGSKMLALTNMAWQVRATNLVCDAFQADRLPPRLVPLLGPNIRKPNICELKQVRDLQHLARCVEHMDFRGPRQVGDLHPPEGPWDLSNGEHIRMRDRFHCAIYRTLFAGAVLTREYLEPLFLAPIQGPPGFLGRLVTGLGGDKDLMGLGQKDIEYLERFPVYDLEAGQEKWEPAFGDLASWLLDDIETTFTKVTPECPSREIGMDAEQLGRLQEVTFFHAAYELLTDKIFYKYLSHPAYEEWDPIPPPFPGRVRKVSVAMFGIFRPEKVRMPEKVQDSSDCFLVNKPLKRKQQPMPTTQDGRVPDCQTLTPWAADVRWVLDILHHRSGRPNLRDGYPSPPPALRFLEYLLAKFFRARFKCEPGSFDGESRTYMEDYTLGFLTNPDLFRDRSLMGTTWFFAEDKAPSLGYRRLYAGG